MLAKVQAFAQAAVHGNRIPNSDPAQNAASFASWCNAQVAVSTKRLRHTVKEIAVTSSTLLSTSSAENVTTKEKY